MEFELHRIGNLFSMEFELHEIENNQSKEFELQGVAPYCQWNMSYKEQEHNCPQT